jgi:hypothetical protein
MGVSNGLLKPGSRFSVMKVKNEVSWEYRSPFGQLLGVLIDLDQERENFLCG